MTEALVNDRTDVPPDDESKSKLYFAFEFRHGRMVNVFEFPVWVADLQALARFTRVRDERTDIGGVIITVGNRAHRHLPHREVWIVSSQVFYDHFGDGLKDSQIKMAVHRLYTFDEERSKWMVPVKKMPSMQHVFEYFSGIHSLHTAKFSDRLWGTKRAGA